MKLVPTQIHGWPEPVLLPESQLVKRQVKHLSPRISKGMLVIPKVRWDDECGNRRNSFHMGCNSYSSKPISGEGTIEHDGKTWWYDGGVDNKTLIKLYPEAAHLLKYNCMFSDGPSGYLGNTTYHSGERDCWGLLKGEKQQLRNGRTGKLCWELVRNYPEGFSKESYGHNDYGQEADSVEDLPPPPVFSWGPWCRTGQGKARELDAARSSACWPEATDEQLCLPKEELAKLLIERLPALMQQFYKDITDFGFTY